MPPPHWTAPLLSVTWTKALAISRIWLPFVADVASPRSPILGVAWVIPSNCEVTSAPVGVITSDGGVTARGAAIDFFAWLAWFARKARTRWRRLTRRGAATPRPARFGARCRAVAIACPDPGLAG